MHNLDDHVLRHIHPRAANAGILERMATALFDCTVNDGSLRLARGPRHLALRTRSQWSETPSAERKNLPSTAGVKPTAKFRPRLPPNYQQLARLEFDSLGRLSSFQGIGEHSIIIIVYKL